VSRPGIQRHSEAYRYAVERLNDELLCDLSVPVNVFDDGLEVQAGDVRLLTRSQIGVISKPFRIVGTKLLEPGRWGLSLREYDPAKYSSEVVTGPSILDTPWPSASHPPKVNSLTLVEDIYFQQGAGLWLSRIVATWVMPTWPLTDSFRIEVWSSGNLIETGTATATSTSYATSPLKEGLSYEVRVYTISVAGVASAAVAQSIVTTGKLARPGDIITFDGFEVGGETRLTWSYLDALGQKLDTDLAATEIRYLTVTAAIAAGSTAAAWAAASASALRVPYPQSHLYTKAIPAGVWRIMAKALDSVSTSVFQYGQESVNAIFKDVSVTSDTAAFVAATYDFTTPLLSNMVVVPQGWVTSFGESWNSLFTSAMNSYTNSLYTYHMAGTSVLLTEIHDFGAALTGDWFGSFTYSNLGGTAVAYIELSSGPDNAKTVLGATNATPIVLNVTAHAWNTGDEIVVASVAGNTAANGTRTVTVIDADHVSLQDQFGNNVAGSGAYTSGGTATRWVWAAYNTATIKSTARYGRMRISTTGTVLVTALPEMRINVVARSEGGTVAVASSGPTIVTFANHYNAGVSAQVTARGAVFANGVYDRVEISGARGILAGECLRFDGTTGDYVEAPTIAATQLTTFSVECWAKVEVYGATTYTLVSKRAQVAAAFPYLYQLIIVQGHKPRFDIFTNAGAQRCGAAQDCPLGRWFHMAGTYDNGTKVMTLYVDGEVVASLTASGTFVAPDYTLGIGIVPISQSVVARTEPHEGLIDEVRIWNTVRTQAQIKALKDTPATGSESGLVALYHFDSLSGSVATDSTSNANHGTVTGAEWRPLDGMDVYLFDAAGTQISGTAAWAFSGV
jgi:hypothetical protein